MKIRVLIGALATSLLAAGGFFLCRGIGAVEHPLVEISGVKPIAVSALTGWGGLPNYAAGGAVYFDVRSPTLEVHIQRPGVILLAASWDYDGNQVDQPWTAECKTVAELMSDGWAPIGRLEETNAGPHYLFRRMVQAGEYLKLRTRIGTSPYLIVPTEAKSGECLAAQAIIPATRKTLLDPALPADDQRAQAGSSRQLVMLHSMEPAVQYSHPRNGILIREIVLQGLWLAAHGELGVETRDASLRESFPQEGDVTGAPLEVVAQGQPLNDLAIGIFRRQGEDWEALWDSDFRLPIDDYLGHVVELVEGLSRKEFVEVLKRAGFPGALPSQSRDKASLPDGAEELLGQLTFPSQFAAVRALHREICKEGPSPELTAALARGYAMMGVLSERLWSPAHKVFKARALLYAERAVHQWPTSAAARYGRAYVRALIGLHQTALDDLAAAKHLLRPLDADEGGRKDSGAVPAWSTAIEAYCKFESDDLDAAASDASQTALVRLLEFLAAEMSGSERQVMTTSGALLQAAPDCYRAVDGAADVHQLGFHRQVVAFGTELAERSLLAQIHKVPDMPPDVIKLIDERDAPQSSGVLSRLFGKAPPSEMTVRLHVIDALRAAAEGETNDADLSWGVLAQWLEDVNFLHAWWQVDLAAFWLGWQPDDAIDAALPQVEHHPYGTFLETFRSDPAKARQAAGRLKSTIDVGMVQFSERAIPNRLDSFDKAWVDKHWARGMHTEDAVAGDLASGVNAAVEPQIAAAKLRAVSPYMPSAIAAELTYDTDHLRDEAAELEKRYKGNAKVQAALAKMYLSDQQTDDAIRCFRAAIKTDPSYGLFLGLADIYKGQNDEKNWLATLEEYLQAEDYGLGHAQVQVQIADHFIAKRDWKRARSYADDAAQTWAGWALLKAGECAEALGDWQAAERWYAAASQRYADRAAEWYEFCKRTGRGHESSALQLATAFQRNAARAASTDDRFECGLICRLSGKDKEAATVFDALFQDELRTRNGMYAALQFEKLDDAKARDRILIAMHDKHDQFQNRPLTQKFLDLAQIVHAHPLAGPLTSSDLAEIDKLVESVPLEDQCDLLCAAGTYLDHHGQSERAIDYWKRCMKDVHVRYFSRTLAGASLIEHGVKIDTCLAADSSPSDTGSDDSAKD